MLLVMRCAFCGKNQGLVRDPAGSRRRPASICEPCLNICRTILAKATREQAPVTEPLPARDDKIASRVPGTYRISSSNSDQSAHLCCSFCDTPQHVVDKLIGSPRGSTPAYICDKCVTASVQAIHNDVTQSGPPRNLWQWMARKVGIHSSYIQ
jgi:ATP-dependent protease Clp ATPase subunit